MSDLEFSERVQKADRWSKVIALLVAMAVFAGSLMLTDAAQFSSITAAGAGIGARFLVPYWASITVPAGERVSIEEHPGTGNFHHGAVGGALLVGSLATSLIMAFRLESTPSLWVGGVLTAMVYVVLNELLPRG